MSNKLMRSRVEYEERLEDKPLELSNTYVIPSYALALHFWGRERRVKRDDGHDNLLP